MFCINISADSLSGFCGTNFPCIAYCKMDFLSSSLYELFNVSNMLYALSYLSKTSSNRPTNYEISKKKTYKTNPYAVENMAYNEAKDEYTCPNGRKLKFKRETQKVTENGYAVSTKYYSNDKCGRCPHREKCHSSKNGYRTVKVNQILNEYRPKVLEALTSEEGTLLRMNRSIQIEGVFGVLKEDYGFRRFLTRGKKNVETQFFLLSFALNIEKLCNREKKGRIGLDLFPLNAS